MFQKILVVENQQIIGKGLQAILSEITNAQVETSSFCDDALLKLKTANKSNVPFDLVVTDLFFNNDYYVSKIDCGEKLIMKIKSLFPELKIMIFSVEKNVTKIKNLINKVGVNAFVEKGMQEYVELAKAIDAIMEDKTYYSKGIKTILNGVNFISDITKIDILILNLLANGLKQNELPNYFKENKIPSGSKRTIEGKIESLKVSLNAKTVPHLINNAKNLGLI